MSLPSATRFLEYERYEEFDTVHDGPVFQKHFWIKWHSCILHTLEPEPMTKAGSISRGLHVEDVTVHFWSMFRMKTKHNLLSLKSIKLHHVKMYSAKPHGIRCAALILISMHHASNIKPDRTLSWRCNQRIRRLRSLHPLLLPYNYVRTPCSLFRFPLFFISSTWQLWRESSRLSLQVGIHTCSDR